MLYIASASTEKLNFYRERFADDLLVDDQSHIILSDDVEGEVAGLGRQDQADYILVDVSTSGEMIERGRLAFIESENNRQSDEGLQKIDETAHEIHQSVEFTIDDAISEVLPSVEQLRVVLSENVDHGQTRGPLTRADARNASAMLSSMKSVLGTHFFEGYFEDSTVEKIKNQIRNREIPQVESFIQAKQDSLSFESQLRESAVEEIKQYEETFNAQLEIAIKEFVEKFTASYQSQLPPITIEEVVSRPDNRQMSVKLSEAAEDALDLAQNDLFVRMLSDSNSETSRALLKYVTLKSKLETNFLETLKEEQSGTSVIVEDKVEQPQDFIDYIVSQEEVTIFSSDEVEDSQDDQIQTDEEVSAAETLENVETESAEEWVTITDVVEDESIEEKSDIMDDLVALTESSSHDTVIVDDLDDSDIITGSMQIESTIDDEDAVDPDEIDFESVDIFEGVKIDESDEPDEFDASFEETPLPSVPSIQTDVPSFDDVVESTHTIKTEPVEKKSGAVKTVAAISAATLLFGATAFGVTGFVYPGFMLDESQSSSTQADSQPSNQNQSDQNQSDSDSKQSDNREGVQKNFQVGDHLEVLGGDKEYSVTIDRFTDSGAIAKDTSGEEWFISNQLLEKWVAEHPERFSNAE